MNELLILLVLLILSGLFSGSETALVSLSMARVEGLVKEDRTGAHALHRLKRDPSQMLITILIGNNLVNIAASAMATVIATERFGHLGPGIAVGVLTVLILVFGEITPKSMATRYAETISLLIAPPMLGFMRLIFPLVWVFGQFTTWVHSRAGRKRDPMVTESELLSMLGHSEREGVIESEERAIIERVFDFNELLVADVMTPRQEMFSLDGSLSVREAVPLVLAHTYSRIPVYGREPEDIRKLLHLRDLLDAVAGGNLDASVVEIAQETLFVPRNQHIDELFSTLRAQKRQLAVVVDELGTVLGIVTVEDLMEELVGEIYDESDSAPHEMAVVSVNRISVLGGAELRLVEEYFQVDLPGKPTDTVSLWILSHTERIPEAGEQFNIDGLAVLVTKATGRRIQQVVIEKTAAEG